METNTSHTVDVSDRKLFSIDNYLSDHDCDVMSSLIHDNMHRFIDRSMVAVNLGLDGSSGKYKSMLVCKEIFPDVWDSLFSNRSINGIPLDSVMINMYKRGDFIPKHRDKQSNIYTISVALQTSTDSLVFSEDAGDLVCKDTRGKGYGFFGNSPVHHVPPVQSEQRITLICLYGPMSY